MATQPSRTNRVKRHKLIATLAVGLSAAAMAIPAAAAARTGAGGAIVAERAALSQDAAPAPAGPGVPLHRDGSKAVPFVANVSAVAPAVDSGTGFDWGDAMIGAGGAVALIAVVGAGGLTIRSRRQVEPAATAQT